MRQAWSDDRLDDLNLRVDNGFKRVDQPEVTQSHLNRLEDRLERSSS